MPSLVGLELPGGAAFTDAVRRAWDAGDAVLPIDPRLPPAARARLLDTLRPGAVVAADGTRTTRGDGVPVDEGDAVVIATSGTTGEAKGVVLTRRALDAAASASSAALGVRPDDHWLACLPLSHIGGFGVVARALVAGVQLTVLPRFDAAAVESAAHGGASLVSLVPTALQRVDTRLFRRILLGGAAPPAGLPSNVTVTYGSTETAGGVVYDGRPLPGVEVEIRDDGEIAVRSPALLRCYRDGTDPRDPGGWLPTGDAGRIASDGRLEVLGRLDDRINSGGENVWPDPVERCLQRHPAIVGVAVVGVPDPEWGERVVAVVELEPGSGAPALDDVRSLVM